MELNVWRWLFCEDDSRLYFRQRIPEVCVFKGCRLEGWYHSNSHGLVIRRTRNVSVAAVLECFLATASRDAGCEGAAAPDPSAPAAILRRRASTTLDGGRGVVDGPHASVLSVQELAVVLQRAQNGIEDEEPDVWTLQTLVKPGEDLRVISVYNCDGSGYERSDIFGRPFGSLYPMAPNAVVIPSPEELAADRCIAISPEKRATLEAKTLGIVRFASRFHKLDFDGLLLEFVFDGHGHAILHGCWCATLSSKEFRKKVRSGSVPGASSLPRVFPVPCPEAALAESATIKDMAAQEVEDLEFRNNADSGKDPSAFAAAAGEGRPVLLELWQGDRFFGEALLPLNGGAQKLRLQAPNQATTRPDKRKDVVAQEACSIVIDVGWTSAADRKPSLLRIALRYAEGLPRTPAAPKAAAMPRVLLWSRQDSPPRFAPLWASRDAAFKDTQGAGAVAVWEEQVELAVSEGQGPAPNSSTGSAAGTLVKSPRNVGTVARQCKGAASAVPKAAASRVPVELAASLRHQKEHVCGAGWETHWGMASSDGTMRGSVLASQVSQRLRTDKINRSPLLSELAMQIEQYHELQSAWEAEVRTAHDVLESHAVTHQCAQEDADQVRAEMSALVGEHEKKIVSVCKEMCSVVDEQRIQEQTDDVALAQSKERIAEQRTMVHQLVDKSHALQGSLDRTVRKFDEVSSSYAQVQGDLMRSQVLRPRNDQQVVQNHSLCRALDASIGQAREVTADIDREEQNLGALKSKLGMLQEELACEKELSLRLEDFVRRIAAAPPARLRTGGGFQLDSTAKSEAAALLSEIEQADL